MAVLHMDRRSDCTWGYWIRSSVKVGYHAQGRFRHCLSPVEAEPAILYEIKSWSDDGCIQQPDIQELRKGNTGMFLTTLLICIVNIAALATTCSLVKNLQLL